MKQLLVVGLLTTVTSFLCAQDVNSIINAKQAERIENVLASDKMRGRALFSPELDKAADFIASEFKAAGLKTLNDSKTYRQNFSLVNVNQTAITAIMDGATINPDNIVIITSKPNVTIDESSGYETAMIKAGSNYRSEIGKWIGYKKNVLVVIDTSFTARFSRLRSAKQNMFSADNNIIFVLGTSIPAHFKVDVSNEINEKKLANVVGVLPGKSRKNEYVIFSGHYDHIGVGKPVNGDSIFNGANDDAAGTTAVILLARYFKKLNNNERTIIFVTFTGEERGGYGSRYFSNQFDPAKVAAMFNIEMIGTESKWGRNSAYITGYERTDMGEMLQKNLKGTQFTFYPDPYPAQQLFFRSDNATLAAQGVPAHTISTSKMDNEPNYHKVTDEVKTLDLENMAMIIRAIALSSRSIVAGKETPSRVKVDELTR